MARQINTLSNSKVSRSILRVTGLMILGVLIGGLVAFDSSFSDIIYRKHLGFVILEYTPSIILVGAIIIFTVCFFNIERLWKARIRILLIGLVLSSQTKGLTSIGFLDLSDFVVLIFLIVWLLEKSTDTDSKIAITPLFVLTVLFLMSMIISFTGQIGASRASIGSLIGPTKWLVIILLVSNYVDTRKKAIFLIKTFFYVTSLSGVVGIVEFVLASLFGLSFHAGKYDFESVFGGTFLRSQAFFGHIHGLATMLAISMTSLFAVIIGGKEQEIWSKKNIRLMLAIMTVALICTFYRGGWIAFGIVAVVCIFMMRPALSIHMTLILLGTFTVIWITGANEFISNKVSQELYSGQFKARMELDKDGIEGFVKKFPLAGTGIRNSRIYITHPSVYPAHNAFIQVADELGIVGIFTYSLIYGYLAYKLIVTALLVNRNDRIIVKALLAGFLTFILITQLEPLAFNFWFWLYFALIESTTICMAKKENE